MGISSFIRRIIASYTIILMIKIFVKLGVACLAPTRAHRGGVDREGASEAQGNARHLQGLTRLVGGVSEGQSVSFFCGCVLRTLRLSQRTILCRRDAKGGFKHPTEMRLISETSLDGDLDQ